MKKTKMDKTWMISHLYEDMHNYRAKSYMFFKLAINEEVSVRAEYHRLAMKYAELETKAEMNILSIERAAA